MPSPRFSSVTHLHVFAIINTLLEHGLPVEAGEPIRLLDVGCGNGVMLKTLVQELSKRHPAIRFEFMGLDVDDSQVQQQGYFEKTVALLSQSASHIDWPRQLFLLKSGDAWPFPEGYFHFIFSNQVMEHVFNQSFLLGEVRRTLHPEGYSFHLYPLRHYIYEGHLHIPFVHKFRSWTATYNWIRWCSRLGLGTYRIHKKEGLVKDLAEYAEQHADYMAYQVNYQTVKEITDTARACRLKASFDFTAWYYFQKLRSIFRLTPLESYGRSSFRSSGNSLAFIFLKYLSGITLLLRKKDSFGSHGEKGAA